MTAGGWEVIGGGIGGVCTFWGGGWKRGCSGVGTDRISGIGIGWKVEREGKERNEGGGL